MNRSLMAAGFLVFLSASTAWSQGELIWNDSATLTLTGAVSYTNVRIGVNGGSTSTIVDATGTTSFTSDGSQFYVGVGLSPSPGTGVGTLSLGPSNTITATQVTIGGLQPDGNFAGGHQGVVTTAANSTTTINAGNMAVGTGKSDTGNNGRFTLGSGATLNLYGTGGIGTRTSLIVGRNAGENSRGTGVMDLSAGIANLRLTSLAVASRTGTDVINPGGQTNGTMTIGGSALNLLDISGAGSAVRVGSNATTSGGNIATNGTLTIGNLDGASSITSTDNQTAVLIGFQNPGYSATGTLNLNGGTLTITTSGSAIAGGGGPSTLEIGGGFTLKAGASSTTWIQNLTNARIKTGGVVFDTNGHAITVPQGFSGTGTPAGGLTKSGAGTLRLGGTNTYTGTTSVNSGILDIASTGSISNSSPLSLNGGTLRYNSATNYTGTFTPTAGTIGGTNLLGSFGGLSIGSGLTLSPGNSPGTASTSSQTWAGGGTYLWEINDPLGAAGSSTFGWDLVSGSDSLTVSANSGAPFTVAIRSLDITASDSPGPLLGFDPAANYAWKIAEFANPISGFAANAFAVNTSGFADAFNGSFSVALGTSVTGGADNQLYMVYTVPEPGTIGLIAAAAGLAAMVRRRG